MKMNAFVYNHWFMVEILCMDDRIKLKKKYFLPSPKAGKVVLKKLKC